MFLGSPAVTRSAMARLSAFAALLALPSARADCSVSCAGKMFSGGPHQGQSVCASEGCGSGAPYVGLATFGCTDDVNGWNGQCCDQGTCSGAGTANGGQYTPPPPPSGAHAGGSCSVPCAGKTFSGGPQRGREVCATEGCGHQAPYVGLATFGCTNDVNGWDGDCCDESTCTGAGTANGGQAGVSAAPGSMPVSGGGGSCDVPCAGKTFSGGQKAGQPVCGNEECGHQAPFIGLATFGCSKADRRFLLSRFPSR